MGSSSSRIGGSLPTASRPHNRHGDRRRRPSFKRTLSSLLICGAASSSRPRDEVEDDPPEILENSAEVCDLEKIHFPAKNPALSTGNGLQYSDFITGTRVSSNRGILRSENSSMADGSGNSIAGDKGESLSQNVESSSQLIANKKASTSYRDESHPESVSANERFIMDVVNSGNRITNRDVPLNNQGLEHSGYPSSDDLEESPDVVSVENLEREMLVFHDCDSASASVLSDYSIDSTQRPSSSGLGFLVSEREHDHRNGNVLQVDVVSPDTLSVGASELNNHEARQDSRRLFWDAFSRRSSRSNADSRTFVFTTDDADGLGSNDGWLLDFSSDLFDNGISGDSRRYRSSNQITNERQWHSSSEIWERFRDVGHNGTGQRTAICPSGSHQDGTCACASTLRAEESGPRASISRIVMLAEALFEVLDEIHRQPMSLSLPMVSLPAPESAVDSLPVKYFRKPERPDNGEGVAQCYICLAEYEEGDKIRVLPCYHDFHASCVDKWLKEIHGVCPLCRGDVRDGIKDGSVSSSGTSSL